MTSSKKTKASLLVAGLLMSLIPAFTPAASAHTASFGSSVSLKYNGSDFTGRVRSSKHMCVRNRPISIKRKQKGPDPTVASTSSGRDGRFSAPEPNAQGRYYAVAARKVKTRYGHTHTCKPATSGTIKV
jgi:hypothetical protein